MCIRDSPGGRVPGDGAQAPCRAGGHRRRRGWPVILVVDNYDSFTFNLVQALQSLGAEVEVHRNDELSVEDVRAMKPDALVLSPGPCTPSEAGISVPLIRSLSGTLPILGVCLGHQSIGVAFGGVVRRAGRVVHGKTSPVAHE